MHYVAFLRGINVGENKPIKMDALKATFVSMGFKDVQTILASGNVVFEAIWSADALARKIEEKLQKTFGHEIPVFVRSMDEINKLLKANPFKRVKVTPQTRLYVTFLSEKPKAIPASVPGFKVLQITATEVCTVLTVTPDRGTVKLMGLLEKTFGKNITTRNWNTIEKVAKTT